MTIGVSPQIVIIGHPVRVIEVGLKIACVQHPFKAAAGLIVENVVPHVAVQHILKRLDNDSKCHEAVPVLLAFGWRSYGQVGVGAFVGTAGHWHKAVPRLGRRRHRRGRRRERWRERLRCAPPLVYGAQMGWNVRAVALVIYSIPVAEGFAI
jgi:hypothetical protein